MLIKANQPKLGARDPLVWDLVEYFNQKYSHIKDDEFATKKWQAVDDGDVSLIYTELTKCQTDYRYAAQNYFWISDKQGNDQLLRLWDGQEILLQKMEDMKRRGKPQRVIVIKARQLGLSLFGNSLVFWNCAFKQNRKGLIVSEDQDQSINLFNNYLSPMYRQLPWWLKPRYSSFKLDEGIVFDVPVKQGGIGLNSAIRVQWSSRKGGLGQGYRLNAFHGSEFTTWDHLREVLEEDLKYALVNHPDTIGILESTAKGAGTDSHAFYIKCQNLAEKADWEAHFLPYFLEKTRVMAPPQGWRPGEEETRMRDVVLEAWAQCSHKPCGQFFNRKVASGIRDGEKCPVCNLGTLSAYTLTDEQIYFIVNEKINATDPRSIKQELALTAEEAFIAGGELVFSDKSIENVEYMVQKAQNPKVGFFDRHGLFHGYNENDIERKCHLSGCQMFHESQEQHLSVWEEPIQGARYQIGVDVGYGKGKDDSVAWVNRIGSKGSPDIQVAVLVSGLIEPIDFAYEVAKLGRWYNDATVAVEYNSPGNSTADQLLKTLSYPNIYRKPTLSGNSYHWQTQQNTKPALIVSMDRWLKEGILIIRDKRFLQQLKVYTKIEETQKVGAQKGFKDDVVMASMLALYTAHQGDYEDNLGIIPTRVEDNPEMSYYKLSCQKCGAVKGVDHPALIQRCPLCSSAILRYERNLNLEIQKPQDPARAIRDTDPTPDGYLSSYERPDSDYLMARDYSLL